MTENYDARQQLALADAARTLTEASTHGALASLDPREGYPYVSIIELLPIDGGDVVFFISDLAAHTTNVRIDGRASLLLTDPLGQQNPLSHERLTLMGKVQQVEAQEQYKDAFLTIHPKAANYIHFKDFNFWRLHVERARYIAGFGRMDWLETDDYLNASPDSLATSRVGIIEHMNEDHEANLLDYLHAFRDLTWANRAKMHSVDVHGFDVRAYGDHEDSGTSYRFGYPEQLSAPNQVRKMLVQMARSAREILGEHAHTGG